MVTKCTKDSYLYRRLDRVRYDATIEGQSLQSVKKIDNNIMKLVLRISANDVQELSYSLGDNKSTALFYLKFDKRRTF